MKIKFFSLSIALFTALTVFSASAEKADRDKPMNIEADALKHDDQQQLTTFTGKVQMTKGSLVLKAHRMEVRQDNQGNQVAKLWSEAGERVFFRQKREGLDEYTEGEADMAIYDKQADQVTLIQRAEARILRGTEVANQMTGDKIVFNNTTEVMTVDGQPKGQAAAGRGERVRAVLTPRKEASAPAPTATPVLRSSPTLVEGKKP